MSHRTLATGQIALDALMVTLYVHGNTATFNFLWGRGQFFDGCGVLLEEERLHEVSFIPRLGKWPSKHFVPPLVPPIQLSTCDRHPYKITVPNFEQAYISCLGHWRTKSESKVAYHQTSSTGHISVSLQVHAKYIYYSIYIYTIYIYIYDMW